MRSKKPPKDQRKIEKQISDEIHRIFDDADSFYYCLDADFTNNLQRKDSAECDDRFFWNKYMLKDILALDDRAFVVPVIQGFVQLEQCVIGDDQFSLALVSRRSRHRAGTRCVGNACTCTQKWEKDENGRFIHQNCPLLQV